MGGLKVAKEGPAEVGELDAQIGQLDAFGGGANGRADRRYRRPDQRHGA